jgi:hypothetical protein
MPSKTSSRRHLSRPPKRRIIKALDLDGRNFDHRTLKAVRLLAVECVLDGGPPTAAIDSYRFGQTTNYKWLAAAGASGVGVKALLPPTRPGGHEGSCRVKSSRSAAGSMAAIRASVDRISALDVIGRSRAHQIKSEMYLRRTGIGELLTKVGLLSYNSESIPESE